MKKFLFVDLDDTLFQTPGKCANEKDLIPVAFLKDGSACSFTTSSQRAFFEMMSRSMTLIPTTARNRDALIRVSLPFNSYSIIDYGGIILDANGSANEGWMNVMKNDTALALGGLNEAIKIIDNYCESNGLSCRARLISDYSLPFYIVVKDVDKVASRLEPIEKEALAPWIAGNGKDFYIHRNGNNLAVIPKSLNKARAVEYLCQRLEEVHGKIMTIGMGDSKSDARFMSACDYAIIPKNTQLSGITVGAL